MTVANKDKSAYRAALLGQLGAYRNSVKFVGSADGNEGHSGWTAKKLTEWAPMFFAKSPADVVLLQAGTNELARRVSADQALLRMLHLIHKLRALNPNVTIFVLANPPVTRLIPLPWKGPEPYNFNLGLPAICSLTGANFAGIHPADPGDMAPDGIHPGWSGNIKTGTHWGLVLRIWLQTRKCSEASPSICLHVR